MIAIDGTAASGKTTTSLAVTKKYNLMIVTTGKYYRAISLFMIKNYADSGVLTAIKNFLRLIELSFFLDDNSSRITINNIKNRKDTELLKTMEFHYYSKSYTNKKEENKDDNKGIKLIKEFVETLNKEMTKKRRKKKKMS